MPFSETVLPTPPASDALAWAHPIVREWFVRKFDTPTEPQALGWPHILAGRSTLISAPTGSGKTLAAFLACIDALVRKAWYVRPGGFRRANSVYRDERLREDRHPECGDVQGVVSVVSFEFTQDGFVRLDWQRSRRSRPTSDTRLQTSDLRPAIRVLDKTGVKSANQDPR